MKLVITDPKGKVARYINGYLTRKGYLYKDLNPVKQDYMKKAEKALLKKQYKKAYKYLHKAKTFKVEPFIVADEAYMFINSQF